MANKNNVIDTVKDCCSILKINPVGVSFEKKSIFKTETQFAFTVWEKDESGLNAKEIIFNENLLLEQDFFIIWCVAHECRHVWQSTAEQYVKTVDSYKSSDKTNNTSEYNQQDLEIDAHAFAYVYLSEKYKLNVMPPLPDEIVERILLRAEYIRSNL